MVTTLTGWEAHRRAASIWHPPPAPLVVLAPHPDDEALMFGGLLAHQTRRGGAVTIVAVTDGEAAYADVDAAALRSRRIAEQRSAINVLGVESRRLVRLAIPDGDVEDHQDALVEQVLELTTPETLLVAPWVHDHHCDHEAVGRASVAVAQARGCRLAAGLFWTWIHTDPSLMRSTLARLPLDDDDRRRKRAAVECHVSQLDPSQLDPGQLLPREGHTGGSSDTPPVLIASTLEPLDWDHEYYVLGSER